MLQAIARVNRTGFGKRCGIVVDYYGVAQHLKEALAAYAGPFLFGRDFGLADAMYAPVVTRFLTYDVAIDKEAAAYCKRIMALPAMQEWVAAAREEPAEIDELDAEF